MQNTIPSRFTLPLPGLFCDQLPPSLSKVCSPVAASNFRTVNLFPMFDYSIAMFIGSYGNTPNNVVGLGSTCYPNLPFGPRRVR